VAMAGPAENRKVSETGRVVAARTVAVSEAGQPSARVPEAR
jgi:hypothetical protein